MPYDQLPNRVGAVQVQSLSCSVCWEDFSQVLQLEEHIRNSHPERIIKEEELFIRRSIAS
jgi:hypothetical protein